MSFEPLLKRVTKSEEAIGVRRIWQEIFGDDDDFLDSFYDAFPMMENTFVAKDGEKVVGIVNAIDCELLHKEKHFFGKYIYALAVDKEYRGKGLARKLLEISESGSFVLLVPETPELFAMYDKLGYKEKADVDDRFVDPCLFVEGKESSRRVSALVKLMDDDIKCFDKEKSLFFIKK